MSLLETVKHDFKTNLNIFIDEILMLFPNESEFVLYKTLLQTIDTENVMDKLSEDLLPFRDCIKARNEDFFTSNKISLFDSKFTDKNHLQNLWKSDYIDDEDRDVIWDFFNLFVNLTSKYQQLKQNKTK